MEKKRVNGSSPQPEVEFDPTKLSHEALQCMRKAGYPKPEGVDWGDWLGPRRLTHRHEIIAMYAATGVNARTIARSMGYTESRISIVLNSKRMKDAIKTIRDQHYGQNVQARMNSMNQKAVDVIEEILNCPNERNAVKLNASRELLNRTLGKPKETLEIQNGSIREIFAYLDANRNSNSLALAPEPTQAKREIKVIDVTPAEQPAEAVASVDRDAIDSWIESNVPSGETIGKKK